MKYTLLFLVTITILSCNSNIATQKQLKKVTATYIYDSTTYEEYYYNTKGEKIHETLYEEGVLVSEKIFSEDTIIEMFGRDPLSKSLTVTDSSWSNSKYKAGKCVLKDSIVKYFQSVDSNGVIYQTNYDTQMACTEQIVKTISDSVKLITVKSCNGDTLMSKIHIIAEEGYNTRYIFLNDETSTAIVTTYQTKATDYDSLNTLPNHIYSRFENYQTHEFIFILKKEYY